MSCAPFDLRDYCFEELGPRERQQVESHLAACASCRAEVERWRMARQALLRVREEEIPQRIAFVSDKVFEPSWFSRWWPRAAVAAAFAILMFVAGAWITRLGNAEVMQTIAAIEARHEAEKRDIEQTYEVLMKQMNEIYRREAEIRPASYRQ